MSFSLKFAQQIYLDFIVCKEFLNQRSIFIFQSCMMQSNAKLQSMPQVLISDLRKHHFQQVLRHIQKLSWLFIWSCILQFIHNQPIIHSTNSVLCAIILMPLTWMMSSAVSLVWRRDETKIRTGFAGEWVHMAAYAGLFMLFILGQ